MKSIEYLEAHKAKLNADRQRRHRQRENEIKQNLDELARSLADANRLGRKNVAVIIDTYQIWRMEGDLVQFTRELKRQIDRELKASNPEHE